MNRLSNWMTAVLIASSQTPGAFCADSLPKPTLEDLQATQQQVGDLFARANELLGLTDEGQAENDAKARVLILDFSKNLEKLQDALDKAEANYNDNKTYGRAIKESCLATRKLFLGNSRARNAAAEKTVGQLRPDNPAFNDNRSDVQDIRNTVYCPQIEKTVDANPPGALQNSTWQSKYGVNGKKVDASLHLRSTAGDYQAGDLQGQLFDIVYFPNYVAGRWQANGVKGWFEFPLSSDQKSFSGFWGNDEIGSPISGDWSGHKN